MFLFDAIMDSIIAVLSVITIVLIMRSFKK
jgi:hypothetical protein